MSDAVVRFEGVWKKFRRGRRMNQLRDLLPSLLRRMSARAGEAPLDRSEFWALRDVSFEVAPGEALGVIGPNGSGKSTTLRLLTRIMEPDRGRCSLTGRAGALVELSGGFHPDLTGRENVFFQGAIMGMRRAETARRFDEIVAFSGLQEFIDTPVKRYSSGMQARLGFSVAAHLDPDVLLIDEVLAVGDASFQDRCHARLSEFRRRGAAVLFVSHNLHAVSALCERVLLLRPDRPPVLGGTVDVVTEYLRGPPIASDARVDVRGARLLASGDGDARPLDRPVAPGAELRLEIDFAARESLPGAAIGLTVRSFDGTVLFDGSALERRDIAAGEAVRAVTTFHAHLLRGTYTIGASIVGEGQRWRPISFPNVASFVVHETSGAKGQVALGARFGWASGTSAEK